MSDISDEKYRAPALDKGLDILELLAASPDAMTQAEIAKGLNRGANEIYRMLETLRRRQYVNRTPSGDRYMLSLRLLVLANMYSPRRRLLDIAEPLLRRFTMKAEQSVQLALIEYGRIVIVNSFSAPGSWRLSIRPGSIIGLYNTGLGIVLAAFSDPVNRKALLEEHTLVEGETKLDDAEFSRIMAAVRARGFSDMPSQTVAGTTNLSYPILDVEGNAIAAISCPFIKRIDSHGAPGTQAVVKMLGETAAEISAQVCGTQPVVADV